MDAGRLFGRGLSFPPRVGTDGRVAWSEGDTNVREAIYIILMTQLQERIMLPEFGGSLGLFLFEPNTVTTRHLIKDAITKALARWEPRIAVEAVQVEEDSQDTEAAIATITYKLVATQVREQVSLALQLTG